MKCQATISGQGFRALDLGAPWCDEEAVTTVRLTLVSPRHSNEGRCANVWLCEEHYGEFVGSLDV